MLFSKTAKQNGASGFFFDDDKNAPGDVIKVSNQDAATANNLPAGASFDFDADGTLVVIPAPVLSGAQIKAQASAAKWESIKTERDRRKSGGFKVKVGSSNKWFHSDADSRIQHLGLKDKARDLLAGGGMMTDKLTILGQTVKWKTMDGTFVDVSAQVAFDIVSSAGDLDAQLFVAAETHKAAMEASADPANYDFSAGWPNYFGEVNQ